MSKPTVKPFLTVAFLLLAAVVLLLTRIGPPLPLPTPHSPYEEHERQREEEMARYAAEQDLEPADSLFSSISLRERESLRIRDALLPGPEYRKCQLVALPAFDVPWAVYLTRDTGAAPRLVYRHALETAWVASMEATIDGQGKRAASDGEKEFEVPRQRDTLDVATYEAEITAETADMLEALWTRMLERVRYPVTPWLGEDGESFHVSQWSPGRLMSGQTWSPPEGSRPSALVNLSRQMAAFAQAPSAEREQQLKADASALLQRLQQVPAIPVRPGR